MGLVYNAFTGTLQETEQQYLVPIPGLTSRRMGHVVTLNQDDEILRPGQSSIPNDTDTSLNSTGRPIISTSDSEPTRIDYAHQARSRIEAFSTIFGEDALVLGHILFRVPPLAIKINKQNIIYKWKSLRTKESSMVNSGNGECFIEISLAFVGKDEFNGPLSNLIILWNSCPFCFIENAFIRKQMIPSSPEDSMAVCLETLVLDVAEGMPDTIWATLQLRWFNYKPFSKHFTFRQDFTGRSGIPIFIPSNFSAGNPIPISMPPHFMPEPVTSTNSFVNLTQLENLDSLRIAYPPEVRNAILSTEEINNNGIQPTNPVVYPFNSSAFLSLIERARVSTSEVTYQVYSDWTDNVTFQWSSYANIPWPSNLISSTTSSEEVYDETQVQSTRDINPSPEQLVPATGTRNIVLFVGDSITRGYLGLTGHGDIDTLGELTESQQRFPHRPSGYRYHYLAEEGVNSTAIKNSLLTKMNETTPVNLANEVAFVVIGAGTNDVAGTNTVQNVNSMVEKAIGAGAIAVVLPIWPIGDADETHPGQASAAVKALLNERNSGLLGLGGTVLRNHKISINTHLGVSATPERLNGAWKTEYRQTTSTPGEINMHPNANGYRAIAMFIHANMPWNARTNADETYRVIDVLDGDTADVIDSNGETIRLRFQFIDTPELTQSSFGHDWGIEARDYLQELLPANTQVQLRRYGSDTYGREIAVVIKNGVNINLKLVKDGKAVVYRAYCPEASHEDFYSAEERAKDVRVGVWESFPEHDGDHRRPWDYRHSEVDD